MSAPQGLHLLQAYHAAAAASRDLRQASTCSAPHYLQDTTIDGQCTSARKKGDEALLAVQEAFEENTAFVNVCELLYLAISHAKPCYMAFVHVSAVPPRYLQQHTTSTRQ
eukprot:scaffold34234_cov23-Tisochrysis_lutea.AAC.1